MPECVFFLVRRLAGLSAGLYGVTGVVVTVTVVWLA
jgi:hypothetical protein